MIVHRAVICYATDPESPEFYAQNPSLQTFVGFFGGGTFPSLIFAACLHIALRFQASISRLLFYLISIHLKFSFAKAFPEASAGEAFLRAPVCVWIKGSFPFNRLYPASRGSGVKESPMLLKHGGHGFIDIDKHISKGGL